MDEDGPVAFQATEGDDVDLLPQELSTLPGSGRLAKGRQGGVEVEGVVGGDGDVDVAGGAAGEGDAAEGEREVAGGGADDHPPSGGAEVVDEGVQEVAGDGEVAVSQGCEGAHRSS